MKSMFTLASLLLMTLISCDGPREEAGEKADAAAGAEGSNSLIGKGPAERMGEKEDAAADSRADALEAQADSLEAAAAKQKEAARQRARALRKKADEAREVQPPPLPPPSTTQDVNGM